MKDIFALTQLAKSGAWGLARGAFQGYGANVGILHLHSRRVRGTWLGNHISQHAGFNSRCQEQLWNNITLSASARSLENLGWLRKLALCLLKAEKSRSSKGKSINTRRLIAGWKNDYLLTVLAQIPELVSCPFCTHSHQLIRLPRW